MPFNYQNGIYKDEKVEAFASFNANQPFSLELIQGRNVSLLYGTVKVEYSTPAGQTAPASPVEDGLAKLVKNLKLQYGGGAGTPAEFLDLQQCNLYGNFMLRGSLRNDQPQVPAAGASATGYVDFIISPSLKPMDPQDLHYCVPGEATHIDDLVLTGTWGSVSDMFGTTNNVQIDSANIKVYRQAGWVFSPNMQAMRNAVGVDGQGYVPMPLYNPGTKQINQAVSGLGLDIELPTDVILRRIFLMVKNANGVRDDDIMTNFAMRTSDGVNLIGEHDFVRFQAYSAIQDDLSPFTGCIVLNMLRDMRDPTYAKHKAGLVLAKQGKLTLAFGSSAQGRVDYLFDSVKKFKVM